MKLSLQKISVADLEVHLVRKRIKNLNLSVRAPHGEVRLSIPWWLPEAAAQRFVMSRLDWLKDRRARIAGQAAARPTVDPIERRRLEREARQNLALRLPPIFEFWQPRMGVQMQAWGLRRMRTRWGSCNPRTGKIWISIEMASKSDSLLEYLVVHELAHLIEPSHNHRFKAVMDRFLPDWRQRRIALRGSGAPPNAT